MSDLISRQAAIDRINKQREYLQPDIYPQDKIGDAAYRICAEFIERLPSADVQPVRHGHWIRGSGYPHHIFCSICYATYVPNDEWDIWKTDGSDCFRLQRNFCPYCGARMDGE